MSDFITSQTKIKTTQVTSLGNTRVLNSGFLLTDVLISNNSQGKVTLLATDDFEHTHIICSLAPGERFNHAFTGGWTFWDKATLEIVKEVEEGEVNVAIGYVKVSCQNYYVWRSE
jgi:hypothetical protein